MKGALLGLGERTTPTQAQIDASPLFQEKPSDKSVIPANITKHWLALIREDGLRIDGEPPHRVWPPKGEALLYRYKDLLQLQPTVASAWSDNGKKMPVFVAVVPASTPLPLDKGIGLECFHNMEALNKVTIGQQAGKGQKTQYSCGYCGIRIQNTETCLNHIRAHLRPHLVCGGCMGHYSETHGNMSGHMGKCRGVKNVKEQEQKALDARKGSKKGASK